jgi:hypothetical protein
MTEAQEEQLRSVTRPESFSFQDEQFDLFRHRFSPILTTQHRTAVSECPPTNPSADFTDEIGVAVVRATPISLYRCHPLLDRAAQYHS